MRMIKWVFSRCKHCPVPCADPEGGQGVRIPPEKITKNKEFLSKTGPDPLEFSKLPSQHSTLGHHRHASETPFKGVSLAGDIWILSPLKKKNNSDPDQIRMEFRKECFVNLNIWPCDRKHAKHQYCRISDFVVQKPMHTRSISKPMHDIFRDYKRLECKR